MLTLKPTIAEVNVATSGSNGHNGVVKIHINADLGQAAEKTVNRIARSIKGIAGATILGDKHFIVLMARERCTTEEQLRRLFASFSSTLITWFASLDADTLGEMTYRPDPAEFAAVNSFSHWSAQED
jgi:hypothetical protein